MDCNANNTYGSREKYEVFHNIVIREQEKPKLVSRAYSDRRRTAIIIIVSLKSQQNV